MYDLYLKAMYGAGYLTGFVYMHPISVLGFLGICFIWFRFVRLSQSR